MSDELDDYVYTDLTPDHIDRELDRVNYLITKWNKILAWHRAQKDWRATRFAVAEARQMMSFTGAVGKAKAYAAQETEQERIDMDIANAQHGLCERRLSALEKELIAIGMRSKLLAQVFGTGGGNY